LGLGRLQIAVPGPLGAFPDALFEAADNLVAIRGHGRRGKNGRLRNGLRVSAARICRAAEERTVNNTPEDGFVASANTCVMLMFIWQ